MLTKEGRKVAETLEAICAVVTVVSFLVLLGTVLFELGVRFGPLGVFSTTLIVGFGGFSLFGRMLRGDA